MNFSNEKMSCTSRQQQAVNEAKIFKSVLTIFTLLTKFCLLKLETDYSLHLGHFCHLGNFKLI